MEYWVCYLLLLVAFVFSLYAQIKVNSSFKKYNKVLSSRRITGAQAAREILDSKGLYSVSIEHVRGSLTDHYDPTLNVVRLSDAVYNSTSVASIGIAAHECGHAIQHAEDYKPVVFRTRIVGVTNICSRVSYLLILFGIILDVFWGSLGFFFQVAGVVAFAVVTFFQLVTLPVEYNASSRAVEIIRSKEILAKSEMKGAESVLSAAALTYLAALCVSLLQLLRLILLIISRSGGRRR